MWYCASLSVQIHTPEFIFSGPWVKTWKEKKCVGIIKEDLRETGWVGVFLALRISLYFLRMLSPLPLTVTVSYQERKICSKQMAQTCPVKRLDQLTIENLNPNSPRYPNLRFYWMTSSVDSRYLGFITIIAVSRSEAKAVHTFVTSFQAQN